MCVCVDIAISAPFVDDGSGAEGSVYIYLGSGDDFIQQTAEQVSLVVSSGSTYNSLLSHSLSLSRSRS